MDSSDAPSVDLGRLILNYVAVRDRKREIERKHKDYIKSYDQVLDEISSKLMKIMQDSNVDSLSTEGGTAYQVTKASATIRDPSAFREYVIEQTCFDLVDWRANANAVMKFIDETGFVPPGLNTHTFTKVLVRRPNEKE